MRLGRGGGSGYDVEPSTAIVIWYAVTMEVVHGPENEVPAVPELGRPYNHGSLWTLEPSQIQRPSLKALTSQIIQCPLSTYLHSGTEDHLALL